MPTVNTMQELLPTDSPFHNQKRNLRSYLLYRLFLSCLLIGLFFLKVPTTSVGNTYPLLFLISAASFFSLSLLALVLCSRQDYKIGAAQLFFIVITDIVALTLMMHASGGLGTGLGYLLIITVAVGSYFFQGQLAMLTAAIASISLLVESGISVLFIGTGNTIFAAGILGILIFITAVSIQRLSKALTAAQQEARSEAAHSAKLQELNEQIISRMLTGILVVDEQGTIELINSAALELLRGNENRLSLTAGQSIQQEPQLANQLAQWKKTPFFRAEPFIPANSNTEVQANFKPLEQSKNTKIMVFLDDARAASQHAQQLKLASLGRLTGSIAHEIRNPLGAISHAAELLDETLVHNEVSQKFTQIINKQVKRVNQIVENVLQLSRRQEHHFQKFDLHNWVKSFASDYIAGAENPPEIQFDPCQLQVLVTFDPIHLEQIITNLLDNGVRYSHQNTGKYWAGIRTGIGQIDKVPYMDILDRGVGVPPKYRAKLFEPFFTTSNEGSGLGLYIARELCQINYATLHYFPPRDYKPGFFRIGFAHPGKILQSD